MIVTNLGAATTATASASGVNRALVLGRALIALLFVASGVQKTLAFDGVADWVAGSGVPLAPYALAATIALEVIAGLALLSGWRLRWVAWLLIAFVVVATAVFHAFWALPSGAGGRSTDAFLEERGHRRRPRARVGATAHRLNKRRRTLTESRAVVRPAAVGHCCHSSSAASDRRRRSTCRCPALPPVLEDQRRLVTRGIDHRREVGHRMPATNGNVFGWQFV